MIRSAILSAIWAVVALVPAEVASQEGTIAYTHSVELDLEIPEEMRARFEARGGARAARGGDRAGGRGGPAGGLPTQRVSDVVLLFNASQSLMKPVPPERRERGARAGGEGERARRLGAFMERRRMGSATRSAREQLMEAHVDYEAGTIVESREFLGRTFLIEDERPAYEWRLSSEQAEFLGYPVIKATAEHGEERVEAWFTPQIPVPAGPGPYGGLPGMILVVSVNDGHTQYTATAVSLTEVADDVIVRPADGETVTREEYEQIVEEKLDELRRTRGGSE